MSDSMDGIGLDTRADTSQAPSAWDSRELYFDDESLEDILYPSKKGKGGPTPANLYLRTNEQFREFIAAVHDADFSEAVDVAERLGSSDLPMSTGMAMDIARVMRRIIPLDPLAALPCDLRGLRPLLEKVWCMATDLGDDQLVDRLGTPVFRWYEHSGEYSEARRILRCMIERSKAKGDRHDEGILINNFAFEYYLEERYEEALEWFSEAVRIFDEVGDRFEMQNARANCLFCVFEIGDTLDLGSIEAEIKEMQNDLASGTHWQKRKPHLLSAMVEERRGRLIQAIRFARKAAACTKSAKSSYYEMDRHYLAKLKKKFFESLTGMG